MVKGRLIPPRIKKAYRRKALELHPDRNYGDVENATRLFAEVQSAYQVLSDAQERAWYDSHREAILRDVDVGSSEHFENNAKVTTAAELSSLMGKFRTSVPFTDAPNGFYGKLKATFETLAEEEYIACDWEGIASVDYPTFGTADASYEDVVKPFYSVWTSFSTRKTFSWKDVHNYSEAPDRMIRRLMEKENKRLREEATKDFNDAVRSLVMFVRKRDPRYIANIQTEAQRQAALKEAAKAQAARARALQQAKIAEHVQPSWAQTAPRNELDGTFSDSEEEIVNQIECVICDKVFKSEKQYEAHEKSKKHIKAVQQLKRQMRKENKMFNLDPAGGTEVSTPQPASDVEYLETASVHDRAVTEDQPLSVPVIGSTVTSDYDGSDASQKPINDDSVSETDDEYAPREAVESRISGGNDQTPGPDMWPISETESTEVLNEKIAGMSLANEGDVDTDQSAAAKKLGKAKANRAKKAAKEAAAGNTVGGAQY